MTVLWVNNNIPGLINEDARRLSLGGATAANQCEGAYSEGGRGLSSAWTRILPNGDDEIPNEEGLRFYHEVFDECLK